MDLLTELLSHVFKVFHEGHSTGANEERLLSHQADRSFDTGTSRKAGGGKLVLLFPKEIYNLVS